MTFRKKAPPITKINKSIFPKYIKTNLNAKVDPIENPNKLFSKKAKTIPMQMNFNNLPIKNYPKIIRKTITKLTIPPKSLVPNSIKKSPSHTMTQTKMSTMKKKPAKLQVKILKMR